MRENELSRNERLLVKPSSRINNTVQIKKANHWTTPIPLLYTTLYMKHEEHHDSQCRTGNRQYRNIADPLLHIPHRCIPNTTNSWT